jgi:hypothetical protein
VHHAGFSWFRWVAAMDHRLDHFLRATSADNVIQWATLEGKSPTMRHDLELRFVAQPKAKNSAARRIRFASELIIGLLEVWWSNRNR